MVPWPIRVQEVMTSWHFVHWSTINPPNPRDRQGINAAIEAKLPRRPGYKRALRQGSEHGATTRLNLRWESPTSRGVAIVPDPTMPV